jgi:hypothetical protein
MLPIGHPRVYMYHRHQQAIHVSTVRAQRPPKVNRGFLDDTDDEEDEEYEEEGKFAIYVLPLYEKNFNYVSSSCVIARRILL